MLSPKLTILCFCYVTIALVDAQKPVIIPRSDWNASTPKKVQPLRVSPPEYAVIHHSAGPTCNNTVQCKTVVKDIQAFHMDLQKWHDIGYNFLVGGDGLVYEGRGFNVHGSHLPELNGNSIGICVLGNFEKDIPTPQQIAATKDFIEYAAKNNYLASNYKVIGHKQKIATQCPGNNLYDQIVDWPNWTNEV